MPNPWELKTDDSRSNETIPLFIIYCEDKVCEPIYFKYFETDKIKVNPVGDQKSKMENVMNAITGCFSEDLMEYDENGNPRLKSDTTHAWCVYDRDLEVIEAQRTLGNTNFDASIRHAENIGIKVAWSNDAFELWILLHFQNVVATQVENSNRVTYYNKLTEVFKQLPNANQDLQKATAHASFGYKKDLKQEHNFRNIVRAEIISNTQQAIIRAKALEVHHTIVPVKPSHQKAPCTMVHHLVEELIALGGKQS